MIRRAHSLPWRHTTRSIIFRAWWTVSVLPDADLLVVDDNSPDGTGKWCDSHAQKSRGFAACIAREIWGWAPPRCKPHVSQSMKVTMFSSRSTPTGATIRSISQIWFATDSRGRRGNRLPLFVPAARSKAGPAIAAHHKPRDEQTEPDSVAGCRSRFEWRLPRVRASALLRSIDLTKIQAAGYSYLEEILWNLRRAGEGFAEVPITFQRRRAGQSKINAR